MENQTYSHPENPVYKLLIIEDDTGIAQAIETQAKMWNFEVHIAENFCDITEEVTAFSPHIILLDITLPLFNGYYWCSMIRRFSSVPIIFISSASDSMNIIMAMNMGADDFIAKPFDLSVLMAKIQALLRRSYDFSSCPAVLAHRGALLNLSDHTLSFEGNDIPLSKNEYRILSCLMEQKGKVISREKLMERLWETDQFVDENTLTVNINRLRKKLDTAGLAHFITTKFGVGYLIEA